MVFILVELDVDSANTTLAEDIDDAISEKVHYS
jgi:hypothetical protein